MTNPRLEEIARRQRNPELQQASVAKKGQFASIYDYDSEEYIEILKSDLKAAEALFSGTGKELRMHLYDGDIFIGDGRIWKLDMRDFEMIKFPDEILNLTGLEELYLGGRGFYTVPAGIGMLTQLKVLTLNHNMLTSLHESIQELKKLNVLWLGNNHFTVLPPAVCGLSGLQVLDLESNQLTALPESISELKKIYYMSLYQNQLTGLPETLGELNRLEELDLSFNKFTSVPSCISRLAGLRRLDLEGNPLEELPEFLADLPKLETIEVTKGIVIPKSIEGKVRYIND